MPTLFITRKAFTLRAVSTVMESDASDMLPGDAIKTMLVVALVMMRRSNGRYGTTFIE